MRLLSAPFAPTARPTPWPWRAGAEIAATSAITIGAAAVLVVALGWPHAVAAAVAAGTLHGAAVALGWVIAAGDGPGWRRAAVTFGAVVAAASLLGRVSAWGASLYLAAPVVLVAATRRPSLVALGLAAPSARAAAAGIAAGALLAVHLLLSASLTFGYGAHVERVDAYLAAVAYDAGASAVTAEWLFRGAVFVGAWRRYPMWRAAALSTTLAVARYLLDPSLPRTVEAQLGAAFYTGLLGVAGCALRAWSGSLVPGYLATLGFFLGYRALPP